MLYSGEDGLFPELAAIGAKGLVSVMSNLWPSQTKAYVDHCLNQAWIDEDLKAIWQPAATACFSAPNPIPVKCWLFRQNSIQSNRLRLPLVAEELESLDQLRQADQRVNHWYNNLTQGVTDL